MAKHEADTSVAPSLVRHKKTDFVPKLIQALALSSPGSHEPVLEALDALDPHWRKRSEAQEIYQGLRSRMAAFDSLWCNEAELAARIGGASAAEPVARGIERVPHCAAQTLAALNDRAALPALLKTLESDSSEEALDRIAPKWRTSAMRAKAASWYVTRLSSAEVDRRKDALVALTRLGAPSGIEQIESALDDREPSVRVEATPTSLVPSAGTVAMRLRNRTALLRQRKRRSCTSLR